MTLPLIPPAPYVHPTQLSAPRAVAAMLRNPLNVYCAQDFQRPFGRRRIMGRDNFGVNDPAGIRHVLTDAAANYVRPVSATRPLRWVLGDGLFLAEGESWRRQRKLLAPLFSPAHVSALLPHFHAAGAEMLARLDGHSEALLGDELNQATLDSLLRALFSTPADAQGSDMALLVREYINGPGRPTLLDGLARSEADFGFLDGKRRKFQARWFALVDALIAARRGQPGGDRDLLDLLLSARDSDSGAPLPLAEVRDQTATMLFAGFETTTRLLFWAAYLLALDPDAQAAIRGEIAAHPVAGVATLKQLDHWPRLRSALLEAMRLYPPVALIVREAVAADEILGEPVAPGTLVWISPWCLHRHEAHWQQPTAFLPERFLGAPLPWTQGAFMPFGGGPRICIGASFAMAEAMILMATLLERHEIGLIDTRPVMPLGAVTTRPDYEPRFSLR